jgi:3-dehydroquinate synthase
MILLGRNFLRAGLLKPFGALRRVLIADEALKSLYAEKLAKEFQAEFLLTPNLKSRETAHDLTDALFKLGCGRDTLLIALGGGAALDLIGFAASIYMRGLPLIFIPTTLLAMVDAAIGGKTGIDTPHGKNLIGTIYEPKAIFADLDLLKTLPDKEWVNGFAEILKMGLIYDASIWKKPDILKAIRGKMAIVGKDPREQGLRRILNFGHTIGHALETVADYLLPHGACVALGCAVEAHLSMRLGFLKAKEFAEILDLYCRFPLRLPKSYTRAKLLSAMAHDKKSAQGEVRFVLIDRIGHAIPFEGAYCRKVDFSELESTLEWMEGVYS